MPGGSFEDDAQCLEPLVGIIEICPPKNCSFDGHYPLVNIHIAMENHHIFSGEIHYFDWAIFNSYVKLLEGNDDSPVDGMGDFQTNLGPMSSTQASNFAVMERSGDGLKPPLPLPSFYHVKVHAYTLR